MQWLCAIRLPLFKLANQTGDSCNSDDIQGTDGNCYTRFKPCLDVCHSVLQKCPYYLPSKYQFVDEFDLDREIIFGGYPAFACPSKWETCMKACLVILPLSLSHTKTTILCNTETHSLYMKHMLHALKCSDLSVAASGSVPWIVDTNRYLGSVYLFLSQSFMASVRTHKQYSLNVPLSWSSSSLSLRCISTGDSQVNESSYSVVECLGSGAKATVSMVATFTPISILFTMFLLCVYGGSFQVNSLWIKTTLHKTDRHGSVTIFPILSLSLFFVSTSTVLIQFFIAFIFSVLQILLFCTEKFITINCSIIFSLGNHHCVICINKNHYNLVDRPYL